MQKDKGISEKRKNNRRFSLFKQYVLWGLTYEMLSSFSGYSIQNLAIKFHKYLKELPPDIPLLDQSNIPQTLLLIDGLWFGRWFALMVCSQGIKKRTMGAFS